VGRDRDPDRPVEPDEARAHGNDPDAGRMSGDGPDGGTRPDESAPRRVGDVREEREGAGAGDRTDPEGHHLTDPDAGVNRATTDAGRDTARGPAGDAQEGWNVPSRVLRPYSRQDPGRDIPAFLLDSSGTPCRIAPGVRRRPVRRGVGVREVVALGVGPVGVRPSPLSACVPNPSRRSFVGPRPSVRTVPAHAARIRVVALRPGLIRLYGPVGIPVSTCSHCLPPR